MYNLYYKLKDDMQIIRQLFSKDELLRKNFVFFLVMVLLIPYVFSAIFTILCNGNECLLI